MLIEGNVLRVGGGGGGLNLHFCVNLKLFHREKKIDTQTTTANIQRCDLSGDYSGIHAL